MKIDRNIVGILEAAQIDGNQLVLVGQLDRKSYEATNKVLTAIGGKWDRKTKAHVFAEPVSDVLDPILITGEYSRTKQDFGQFDTPLALAEEVVNIADIQPGDYVLEPSAGVGRLALPALVAAQNVTVDFYEIDPKRYAALSEKASHNLRPCGQTDFLLVAPDQCYERVVMNPPFAKQADIDHVLHAFNFLRPGGRLVAIMSSSVSFRTNRKTIMFREFVRANSGTIAALPDRSFSESGTNVSASVVTVCRGAE